MEQQNPIPKGVGLLDKKSVVVIVVLSVMLMEVALYMTRVGPVRQEGPRRGERIRRPLSDYVLGGIVAGSIGLVVPLGYNGSVP